MSSWPSPTSRSTWPRSAGAGLTGEIGAQLARGTALLGAAGLHPTPGTWVDTSSDFTSGDATALGDGLQAAHADHLVLDDTNLAPVPTGPTAPKNLTFAQPFSLAVGHGRHVAAAAANSQVDALFTADPGDPVLAANQMIAALEFIHFENAYEIRRPRDRRGTAGVVATFGGVVTTLLTEMAGNPVLSPVTLSQFFAQVPQGGNGEPAARHLQAGAPAKSERHRGRHGAAPGHGARPPHLVQPGRGRASAPRGVRRAVGPAAGHREPVVRPGPARRRARRLHPTLRRRGQPGLPGRPEHHHLHLAHRVHPGLGALLGAVSGEGRPVVEQRQVRLPRRQTRARSPSTSPTTPVRIQARSVTSGDRLPVEVTLTTPDGQLVIARAALTVHSTSISIVGIALTALAALVLLVWWARTWRKGRNNGRDRVSPPHEPRRMSPVA